MAKSKDDTPRLDEDQSSTRVDANPVEDDYPLAGRDNLVGDADKLGNEDDKLGNEDDKLSNQAGSPQSESVSDKASDTKVDPIGTDAGVAAAIAPLASPPAGKLKTGRAVAWLALLLALVAAAGSAYLGWQFFQQQQREQTLGDITEVNRQQIQQFQRSLEAAKNSVADERRARQQAEAGLQSALQEANASIDGHARRLLSLTATTTDDWRLAEVEYLLRLANQRILTSKDGPTALNLLQAADQILLELGDPRLYSVREALANDRAAISLVGELDLDGVFLQLGALARQINQLPLLQVPKFIAPAAVAVPASIDDDAVPPKQVPAWLASVQEIASSTWAELKSLVVIQRRGDAIKPLLPPEQQYYLRNNLRLLINQAQLALLDGRQLPYRESLASAAAWLQESFPMQEPANQRVVKTLLELSELPITAEYPDVSASLLAIKAFMAEQRRLQGAGKAS